MHTNQASCVSRRVAENVLESGGGAKLPKSEVGPKHHQLPKDGVVFAACYEESEANNSLANAVKVLSISSKAM